MFKLLSGAFLFKFLVSFTLLGLGWGLVSDNLSQYQEAAEKAQMEHTIGALRSGLHIRVVELISNGKEERIATLVGQDPMQWLEKRLSNYAGEANEADPAARLGGNWYFDTASGVLTYWVKTGSRFRPDSRNQKKVRLRIQSDVKRVEPNKLQQNKIEGVRLVLLEPYSWED
jgi:hypothetical protein